MCVCVGRREVLGEGVQIYVCVDRWRRNEVYVCVCVCVCVCVKNGEKERRRVNIKKTINDNNNNNNNNNTDLYIHFTINFTSLIPDSRLSLLPHSFILLVEGGIEKT